jgi:hypothetical protein
MRQVGQLRNAPRLLDPTTPVTIETGSGARPIECSVLIDCGDLVLAFDPVERDWLMGQQADDGTVACWASYGTDLDFALKSL